MANLFCDSGNSLAPSANAAVISGGTNSRDLSKFAQEPSGSTTCQGTSVPALWLQMRVRSVSPPAGTECSQFSQAERSEVPARRGPFVPFLLCTFIILSVSFRLLLSEAKSRHAPGSFDPPGAYYTRFFSNYKRFFRLFSNYFCLFCNCLTMLALRNASFQKNFTACPTVLWQAPP